MVPYHGRHTAKMFIRNKPVRFGFKVWCMASACGYLFAFDCYTGKSEYYDPNIGLGSSVVLKLLGQVPDPQNHVIYCDNFFTSCRLILKIKENGGFLTDTVRENRTMQCPLESCKQVAKKNRRYYDFKFDTTNEIHAVCWNDNAAVTLLTNWDTITPLHQAQRYSAVEKRKTGN